LSTESIVEQPEVQRFPGERLQAARLAKGVTVEEISSSLHLPSSYIHALENGDLDKLPSIVFARGYIRSYAKLVELNPEEYIGYLDELYGRSQKVRSVKSVTKVRQQMKSSHPMVRLFSWLFIIVVIGASVWWWKTQNSLIDPMSFLEGSDNTISVETSSGDTLVIPALKDNLSEVDGSTVVVDANPEAMPVESEVTDSGEAPADLTPEQIAQLQEKLDEATPSQAQTDDAEAIAAESARQQESVTAPSRLTITFKGECWVTVKDRDGNSLFNNVRRNGQSVDVSGEAPFSVLLGAANGVTSFKFNGEDVDLGPFSKNNVARLSLPLE